MRRRAELGSLDRTTPQSVSGARQLDRGPPCNDTRRRVGSQEISKELALPTLDEHLELTSGEHRAGLNWFRDNVGLEVPWPEPLPSGLFLANKAKGIHKPSGWAHALSVRQSLGGPYDDRNLVDNPDDSWSFDYAQEGPDPSKRDDDYTNRALVQNMQDGVPIGVLIQVKKKPNPRYLVKGLALITKWAGGYFQLEGFSPAGQLAPTPKPTDTDVLVNALTATPLDLTDARKRINATLVARQGAGIFRAAALKAFAGRCAVTECAVAEVLEAAHIVPYLGTATNTLANTLLLRADIHTLFDRGLLTISDETLQVHLSAPLQNSTYGHLEGAVVRLPAQDIAPWRMTLRQRNEMGKV